MARSAAVLAPSLRRRSSAGPALLGVLAARSGAHDRYLTLEARFPSLTCGVKRSAGPGKGFTANARAGAWKLTVRVYRFSGYHRYLIDYGADGCEEVRVADLESRF